MDKTEQFIKMADCPEIQERWKKEQYGDILACYDKKRTYGNGSHYYTLLLAGGPPIRKSKNRTWLPRQDDIQKMVGFKYAGPGYVRKLWDFVLNESETRAYNSFEQLWLAFYMYEKHGKVWSSKEERWGEK